MLRTSVTVVIAVALSLGLLTTVGHAQTEIEVQTEGQQVQAQFRLGVGLFMSSGTTWPLVRFSAVRGNLGAELDLWLAQIPSRFFIIPALTLNISLPSYGFYAGVGPIILIEEGKSGMQEHLIAKAGFHILLDELEAFSETLFVVAEGKLLPFPAGFVAGISWGL